ncbi:MAG TPA: DUF1772 domain-containing protein [Flavitalea sp.]|nr:DUF1772 domain-containing protein [Flavitalea sp.]
MKNLVLFGSVIIASGLLLVNIYTSLIDAKSWGSDIPNSIATAREYFKTTNPGNFFRLFSPINQVLALLALILFWKVAPSTRLYLGLALVMYVSADVMTFAFFHPRNKIMFGTADLNNVSLLKQVWSEWSSMNWIRSLIILMGVFFSFLSLHRIYFMHMKQQLAMDVRSVMEMATV